MSLLHRALQAIRVRGWRYSLRALRRRVEAAASRLGDRSFDSRFGSDTATFVENDDLRGIPRDALDHGIRYEPTRAAPFRRVLEAAAIPCEGTFVDVGCGKGRVLMLAALAGFERVVGVDYSADLCRLARENLEVMMARGGARFRFDVVHSDARGFDLPADARVVYLYNPFDESILRPVVARWLRGPDERAPAWIIYHNPMWSSVIEETGRYQKHGDYSFGGCDFTVYRGRATATPRTVTS